MNASRVMAAKLALKTVSQSQMVNAMLGSIVLVDHGLRGLMIETLLRS